MAKYTTLINPHNATTSFDITCRSLRVTNLSCLYEKVQPTFERDPLLGFSWIQRQILKIFCHFDIQFTLYVLSPDLTWVRQISSEFARTFWLSLGGMFVCVWHYHKCRTSSQKDHCMVCFLPKCNCRLVERIFILTVSLIAAPNQVLYTCSIKKSLVWFLYSQPFRWKSWKVTMFFSFDRNYYTFLFFLSSWIILFSCATGRGV